MGLAAAAAAAAAAARPLWADPPARPAPSAPALPPAGDLPQSLQVRQLLGALARLLASRLLALLAADHEPPAPNQWHAPPHPNPIRPQYHPNSNTPCPNTIQRTLS
jgi:hypothetical protein